VSLDNGVTGIDLHGISGAKLTSTQASSYTLSDSVGGATFTEKMLGDLDLTGTTLDSHLTTIDLANHQIKLTATQIASVSSFIDSIGAGHVTETLAADTDLTGGVNAIVNTIDLHGHAATLTATQIASLSLTDSSSGGYVIEKLTANVDLSSGLNSHVQEIDLNGKVVKLTDSQITTLVSEHGITDSSSGGIVTEKFTSDQDLTSSTIDSHVHRFDMNGESVSVTETQMSHITLLTDSLGGGTLTEVLDSNSNVSLLSHAAAAITLDVNLNHHTGMSISGLVTNDIVDVGSSNTLNTQEGSAGAVNATGEYFFDSSTHQLTFYDQGSSAVHVVTLTSATVSTVNSDHHTFTVL
jgi:hypothetical protein